MLTTHEVIQQCKHSLAQHYGPEFAGLVLYGSMARGEAMSESDIDLLILLNAPFDYFRELRCIVDLLYPVQLESTQLISAKPAALNDFEQGNIQLYRNAQRDGMFV